MKSYLLTSARYILIISGVGIKILEPQGASDQKHSFLLQKQFQYQMRSVGF